VRALQFCNFGVVHAIFSLMVILENDRGIEVCFPVGYLSKRAEMAQLRLYVMNFLTVS
jgi:hypothetical protein